MRKTNALQKTALYFVHALLVILIFLPLVFALVSSLRPLEELYKYVSPLSWRTFFPANLTFEAYAQIFTEYGFGRAVWNSLLVAFVTVAGGILFNSMAGFAFAKFKFPFKKTLYVITLLTFMVPFELLSFNLYTIIMDLGWVDSYLALIIPCIPNGMVIFLFRQYYLGFPDYLLESAKIDGLNTWQSYTRIVLPNAKPVCISAGLVLFINQWESFLWPVLVTRSKEMLTIQMALNNFRTEYTKLWNLIFAGTILAFLIPIAIIIPLQRFFVAGITSTGAKE